MISKVCKAYQGLFEQHGELYYGEAVGLLLVIKLGSIYIIQKRKWKNSCPVPRSYPSKYRCKQSLPTYNIFNTKIMASYLRKESFYLFSIRKNSISWRLMEIGCSFAKRLHWIPQRCTIRKLLKVLRLRVIMAWTPSRISQKW